MLCNFCSFRCCSYEIASVLQNTNGRVRIFIGYIDELIDLRILNSMLEVIISGN